MSALEGNIRYLDCDDGFTVNTYVKTYQVTHRKYEWFTINPSRLNKAVKKHTP